MARSAVAEQSAAIAKRHRRLAERSRNILDAAARGFHRELLLPEEVSRTPAGVLMNGLRLQPAPGGYPLVGYQNLVATLGTLEEYQPHPLQPT